MGREDGEPRSGPEPLGLSFQGVEAVRIQHQRSLHLFDQAENELLGLWAAPHPWARQHHITATGSLYQLLRIVEQREGHGAGAPGGYHGIHISGHPQIHQARSAAQCSLGGKHRSPGIPFTARHNQKLSVVPLVAVPLPPGQPDHLICHQPFFSHGFSPPSISLPTI